MGRVRETDFEVTERHILNAFSLLAEQGRDGFDIIDRLQLDIVTEVFCGESTNSLTSDQQPFRDAMEILQKIASFRQLLGLDTEFDLHIVLEAAKADGDTGESASPSMTSGLPLKPSSSSTSIKTHLQVKPLLELANQPQPQHVSSMILSTKAKTEQISRTR